MENCNKYLLEAIASIQAGYSIRGKVKEEPNGTMKIIQMKDIDCEQR